MKLDPTKMKNWQIAEAAEATMKPISKVAAEIGINEQEIIPYGQYLAKVDFAKVLERVGSNPGAKYIDVTAITPTPLGEGKTTTTIGLMEGLGQTGQTCIRSYTPAKRRTNI